ncbi:MAG: toll/interleukin-1 receptor domain-containing protein, partial [Acidobacteriota bacterium]
MTPDGAKIFISYNKEDRTWAKWIAWQLEAAGKATILQDWDFKPGSNFALEMDRAASGSTRTLAVLSKHYLAAAYTHPEWAAAFSRDPTGRDHRLVPVRIEDCRPPGLLAQIVSIDLFDASEEEARRRLLQAISGTRSKPRVPPPFPHNATPTFPGLSFTAPPPT